MLQLYLKPNNLIEFPIQFAHGKFFVCLYNVALRLTVWSCCYIMIYQNHTIILSFEFGHVNIVNPPLTFEISAVNIIIMGK